MNKLPIPIDGSCRATYADGFVYDETQLKDIGQYGHKNVFDDILYKRPEAEHGRMVEFSVFFNNTRYDFDWTELPDNARPIRFKDLEIDTQGGQVVAKRLMRMHIGYQFNDSTGQNVKVIEDI